MNRRGEQEEGQQEGIAEEISFFHSSSQGTLMVAPHNI
jgi:hypothetical protein